MPRPEGSNLPQSGPRLLDKLIDDAQSKSRSAHLGGEKWIEYPLTHSLGHPAAGIRDFDPDIARTLRTPFATADRDAKFPPSGIASIALVKRFHRIWRRWCGSIVSSGVAPNSVRIT